LRLAERQCPALRHGEVLAFLAYRDVRRQAQRLRGPDGVFRWHPIRAPGRAVRLPPSRPGAVAVSDLLS
jgi:hypothetical protein